jgi:chaperonin GroES
MQIKPLHDFITIELDLPETVSEGGIVLIQRAPEKGTETGTVLDVGPGLYVDGRLDEMVVKAGDKVLFNKGTGQIVELDKKKVLFLKQRDIMGILR